MISHGRSQRTVGRQGWAGRHAAVVCLLWALGCLLLASVDAADRVEGQQLTTADVAGWVPEEAVVYLEVAEPRNLLELAFDPAWQELLNRSPDYQKSLRSSELARFRLVLSLVETRLQTTGPQLARDLAGSWHLAADPRTQSLLLLAREQVPGTWSKLHRAVLDLVELDAQNKGKASPLSSQHHGDVEIWTTPNDTSAHCLVDGVLMISNRPAVLKAVLDRRGGAGGALLKDTEDFRQAQKQRSPGATSWGLARLHLLAKPEKYRENLAKLTHSNPLAELVLGGVAEVAGTTPLVSWSVGVEPQRLKLAVAAARRVADESSTRQWFFSPADRGAEQLLKPEGMLGGVTVYRDLAALWQNRDQLFNEETTAKLAQADSNLSLYFGDRDFGTQVLGGLSPRWQLVAARQQFAADQITPAIKLPAVALVLEMKDPAQLANPLLLGFQKFVGIVNLAGGQEGKPQLLLGSQTHSGVTISSAEFLVEGELDKQAAPIHFNASPACARVNSYFVVGSTVGIVRQLIDQLQDGIATEPSAAQSVVEIDVPRITGLLADNRESLITQNMLQEANSREEATAAVGLLLEALNRVQAVRFQQGQTADQMTLEAEIRLAPPSPAESPSRK